MCQYSEVPEKVHGNLIDIKIKLGSLWPTNLTICKQIVKRHVTPNEANIQGFSPHRERP